ncbi:hypothetical protein, partial [Burkholderia cepacia]|uniref:hypothetical protein n=1 Tax=Burkholderia cepacia TaxID=292 RepID=UPI0015752712|nr:hypothetical protein [Burkholderia cepacia]
LQRIARLCRGTLVNAPAGRPKLIVVLSLHAPRHYPAPPHRRFGIAARIARGIGKVRFIGIGFRPHGDRVDRFDRMPAARSRERRPARSIYDDRRGPVIGRTRRHHDAAGQHDGCGCQYHHGSKGHGCDS